MNGVKTSISIKKEKNYFLAGAILQLLSAVPFVGIIFTIVGLVLWYEAFKGYEERISFHEPLYYFKRFITFWILTAVMSSLALIASIASNHTALTFLFAVLAIVFAIIEVYYYGHLLEAFGTFFGIEEFHTAKLLLYLTVYGMPAWFLLSFVIIGIFIVIGLAIAYIVYTLLAISHLPDKYEVHTDSVNLDDFKVSSSDFV